MTDSSLSQIDATTAGACPCTDCRCVECRCAGNRACQCPREQKPA